MLCLSCIARVLVWLCLPRPAQEPTAATHAQASATQHDLPSWQMPTPYACIKAHLFSYKPNNPAPCTPSHEHACKAAHLLARQQQQALLATLGVTNKQLSCSNRLMHRQEDRRGLDSQPTPLLDAQPSRQGCCTPDHSQQLRKSAAADATV
jgi:hypothetical protein